PLPKTWPWLKLSGKNMASKLRIGNGYDVHALATGRKLVLGGIEIPSTKGLDGWSDADVLTHAIMDALLGAAALGDIGKFFPPGEPQYKGISSLKLLKTTTEKLAEKGWQVVNIDATVLAERPKLKDFIEPMRRQISQTIGIKPGQVNVKATTSERLGFVGREEGIAAYAVALIEGGKDEDI
ncbi:MAG: 2-C-methyl-D-erythritol 2,4-cyclodiphosphate synthase, partial [Dehalococcoidales bacterium]|nr:2-C-methyl-D-erythritol 2,4-cyclodiphosphate synthase [Dehalococcoidales bacterium]